MLTQEQALDIYKQTGAVLHGHFKLTSGRHSDTYMQSAKLFVQPAQAEKVCAALAERTRLDHAFDGARRAPMGAEAQQERQERAEG